VPGAIQTSSRRSTRPAGIPPRAAQHRGSAGPAADKASPQSRDVPVGSPVTAASPAGRLPESQPPRPAVLTVAPCVVIALGAAAGAVAVGGALGIACLVVLALASAGAGWCAGAT
jgi:hypothetical protein